MLDNALDIGISEHDFWDMTFAELDRKANSIIRTRKVEAQEHATYDYLHARLIGVAVGLSFSNGGEFPAIEDVYPTIFKDEQEVINKQEQKQEILMELSAARFKQFAQNHNNKFKKVVD